MFQQAISTLGQLDGQYQMKTKILAVVRQVKKMEFSQSSGKPKQSLYLTDESGEDSWVTIIGKFDALDDSSLGKQYEFLVWPYKADQSPKTTLYCWINRQVPQTASQGSPQTPQTPYQGINAPPADKIPPSQGTATDARSIAINIASKLVTTGQHTPAELYGLADCIVDYIQYGKHPFGPAGAVPGTMDGSQMDQDFPNEPGSH